MVNIMLLFLTLLFSLICCLSGLNLSYYPAEIKSTNATNVSSFRECVCKCLSYSDCSYFAYWLSFSSSTCQIYLSLENKPQILNYVLTNNDNQTGLYRIPYNSCQSSLSTLQFNYTNNASSSAPLPGNRIISILVMSIGNSNRLLAIDDNNASYYIFDINTFQIVDNGTFLSTGVKPLCAQQFSNLLYIGYTFNIIEVRQFVPVNNSSKEEPQILYTFSTSGGGPPQGLAVLNRDILYYVVAPNDLYVLLTGTNISKHLYTFSGVGFASPSVVIVLDSINMELFLANSVGRLFRVELSSITIDNGTSIISSGSMDQYQMALNILTSLFLDKCNRLWALSSPAGSFKPQMVLFVQEDNSNKSFSRMNIVNYTDSLPPFIFAPYNFQFDDNYTLFTGNAHQGINGFFR